MKKCIFLFIIFLLSASYLDAQEMNASVTVNSTKVNANRQIFQELESDLNSFINDRVWTDIEFAANEKISCTFSLIINEVISDNNFKGELHIQSHRPVFNSTYMSPMFNFRDSQISFDYLEGQPLEFSLNNISNNLTSVVAYYVYLILALDFDSMSMLGGSSFYQKMQTIATSSQILNQEGWSSFSNSRNRASIVVSLNNPIFEDYRVMWYEYHRNGLDEMADNIDAGRKNIVTSLSVISELKSNYQSSILLNIFGDTKLDEIIDVYSNGNVSEKKSAIEMLTHIYPTKTANIDRLRK